MKQQQKVRDMAYIGSFAAMIAACSWLVVPSPVPFTLQTMGVFSAVGILGGRRGTLAVLTYILLGAVGLPVFSGFTGGMGVLLGVTGGYIAGFLCSALLMWAMEAMFGSRKPVLAISMVLGLAACYGFGSAWFMVVYTGKTGAIGLGAVLAKCVLPFILPDLAKISVALFLTEQLKKHIK